MNMKLYEILFEKPFDKLYLMGAELGENVFGFFLMSVCTFLSLFPITFVLGIFFLLLELLDSL